MNYDVNWPERLGDVLLSFYAQTVQGDGRETAELNAALSRIESLLRIEPNRAGESREGDRRVVIVPPLAVEYVVDDALRRVDVLTARYSRGRRS
ncbi:MAG: hypothetical protein U0746_03585 [Gemmataceae bacterium]